MLIGIDESYPLESAARLIPVLVVTRQPNRAQLAAHSSYQHNISATLPPPNALLLEQDAVREDARSDRSAPPVVELEDGELEEGELRDNGDVMKDLDTRERTSGSSLTALFVSSSNAAPLVPYANLSSTTPSIAVSSASRTRVQLGDSRLAIERAASGRISLVRHVAKRSTLHHRLLRRETVCAVEKKGLNHPVGAPTAVQAFTPHAR
ncbi:hypothetical protein EXIGLDRAFT_779304 [Exidia glandulosa HHB12029]|uniref:Uncharacterized protein n=1 Tax=Exidia glandulosa HHB12029 TaxID=1314781 RepID=A0A165C4M4_EXIGL|nr:hypothetical protein EXIGLDRAFT_779304 [Exidia glandulosa HHB12029]